MKRNSLLTIVFLTLLSGSVCAADFESATEAVAHMRVGWNLGNTLESHGSWISGGSTAAYETAWGQPVTQPALLAMLRNAGFGAVRVPVTWYPHMDANHQVDAEWMARVREVVDYVVGQGLYCILNVHHDTGADDSAWLVADEDTYSRQHQRFESLWTQIAEEFRDYDEHLLFEAYNEMLDVKRSWCFASFAASGQYDAAIARSAYNAINSYAQSFVNAVRATGGNNSQRNLVVCTYGACSGGGTWNQHLKDPLRELLLPQDQTTGHLIFEVHSYPNVENLASVKSEIDDMVNALNTYLVAKGAPVIFGEWGSSNVDADQTDYQVRRDNLLAFAKYLVQKAKANGMGTFYWMGLSDRMARSLPAFSQPDLALTILQGWYGDDYSPTLPVPTDFDYYTNVRYTGQWQELNLYSGAQLNLSDYKGLRLEMYEKPAAGLLNVKVYGETSGKEQYAGVSNEQTTVTFNASSLGSKVSRVTLQYTKNSTYDAKVVRAVLLRKDGTEVETELSTFWGCQITGLEIVGKDSTTLLTVPQLDAADGPAYNLWGQRVDHPRRGTVVVRKGRKHIVR